MPRIEPTCFSNGYTEGKQCEICSLVTKPREEIEALNIEHNFVDRVCANCGVADDSVFLLYFLQNIYIDDVKYTCDIDSLKKTNAHHPYAEEIVLPRTINIYGDEYSVVYLEDNLFSEYVSTKYITIQDTVNYIGEKVFRGAKALERIAVDDNNLTYCDVDYVLYTKDKTGLLACPARKQNVVIEKEVKTISEGAFGDCAILGSIFYKGSAQDKQNIIINQDNGPLDSTRWYFYSQERPSESGDFWRYVNGVPTIWN